MFYLYILVDSINYYKTVILEYIGYFFRSSDKKQVDNCITDSSDLNLKDLVFKHISYFFIILVDLQQNIFNVQEYLLVIEIVNFIIENIKHRNYFEDQNYY